MRLVHIADTHLGFTRHERLTALGVNQREADVELSFTRVIDQTIALAPEVVLLAGDIFHVVRPKNRTVAHAFRGFERLRTALPHAVIVMVAGNHDMPRSFDMGCILRLFASLGIVVVDGPTELFDFPALDLSILAVPENHHPRPTLRPETRRRHNVLLLHGETGGISNGRHEGLVRELTDEELYVEEWSYIALGHYHVYKEIAPNEFYAGAIDYTSTDIWGELAEQKARGISGKGIVERDLATGAHAFHPLPCTRAHVDLPPLSAAGMGASAVNAAIAEAVEAIGGAEDKVVRLKVHELDRSAKDGLDQKMLRQFRAKALNFRLEVVKAEHLLTVTFGRPRPLVAPETTVPRDVLRDRVIQGEDVRPLTVLGRIDRVAGHGLDLEPAPDEAPERVTVAQPMLKAVAEPGVLRRVVVHLPQLPSVPFVDFPDPYADDFTAADEARAFAALGRQMAAVGLEPATAALLQVAS